jgi:hypothetical protein
MSVKWERGEPVVLIEIAIRKDITPWRYGETLLESLNQMGSGLTPQFVGISESLNKYSTKEDLKRAWGNIVKLDGHLGAVDVIWPVHFHRRTSRKYYVQVKFPDFDKFGKFMPGSISITASFAAEDNWLRFFKTNCEMLDATAGTLHLIGPMELHRRTPAYSSLHGGLGGTIGRNQLPNLGWATFLGASFSGDLDFDALRKSDIKLERLGEGHILYLTDEMADSIEDPSRLIQRRLQLKKLFPRSMFVIEE